MQIFDAMKKTFGSGDIKLRLKTPRSFKWKHGSIPISVMLTGHKTEPRTVTGLRFTFRDERKDEENESPSFAAQADGIVLEVARDEIIELQPLEKVTVDMDFPLATGGEKGSMSSWVGKIMDAMNMFSSAEKWNVLTVYAKIEGVKEEQQESERIRSLGMGFHL